MSAETAPAVDAVAELALHWRQRDQVDFDLTKLKDTVHLWVYDLEQLDLVALSSRATKSELARAERIRDSGKRQLYLGGRVGLRYLLCRYSGLDDASLKIGYGDRGKPRLENTTASGEICFNYTLSKDKVLYSVTLDRQLGVDLETFPRRVSAERMSKSKLATAEQHAWAQLPEREKQNAMLSCWTRKEAYGKVTGVGIRYYLNQAVLFTALQQPWFQTTRVGMFETSNQANIPNLFEGVQIALPFNGVASLMYERSHVKESRLSILAGHLKL